MPQGRSRQERFPRLLIFRVVFRRSGPRRCSGHPALGAGVLRCCGHSLWGYFCLWAIVFSFCPLFPFVVFGRARRSVAQQGRCAMLVVFLVCFVDFSVFFWALGPSPLFGPTPLKCMRFDLPAMFFQSVFACGCYVFWLFFLCFVGAQAFATFRANPFEVRGLRFAGGSF